MKKLSTGQPLPPRQPCIDEVQRIDAAYGLEPVFEPGRGDRLCGSRAADISEFHTVQCPYCGESFETLIDLSAGSASYIEDCQVCCQPIEFTQAVDHAGTLETLVVSRGD